MQISCPIHRSCREIVEGWCRGVALLSRWGGQDRKLLLVLGARRASGSLGQYSRKVNFPDGIYWQTDSTSSIASMPHRQLAAPFYSHMASPVGYINLLEYDRISPWAVVLKCWLLELSISTTAGVWWGVLSERYNYCSTIVIMHNNLYQLICKIQISRVHYRSFLGAEFSLLTESTQ